MSLRILISLVLFSSVAAAQPADEQIGNAEYLTLFPELRQAAAPEMVTPGLRISYGAISGGRGTGGGGVIQYDVVATDGQTVVLNQVNYADLGAGVVPLGQTLALGIPGLGPAWIAPGALVNAEAVAGQTLSVTRVNKEVAGATREVVRFETTTSNGSRIVDEFSSQSGLMVFSSEGTNEAGSQLGLLSATQTTFPWEPDAAPNWARQGVNLVYTGTKTTTISGGAPLQQDVAVDVQIASASLRWSTFVQSTTIGGIAAGTSTGVTGVAQLSGAFWLPKSALAAEIPTEATIIHQDADTGATTLLVGDAETISLEQRLSGATITTTYSRNLGVLVAQRIQQAGVSAVEDTFIQLTGGSDLVALNQEPALPDNNTQGPVTDPDPDPAAGGGGSKASSGGCNTPSGALNLWVILALFIGFLGRRVPISKRS